MIWPLRKVGDIIEVQPRRHKFKTKEYQSSGALPIVDQGADFIAGYTDELDKRHEGPLPVVIFGDHTCCLKYVDFPFAVGADGTQLLRPIEGVDVRYLYFALRTAEIEQFGYQRHFKLLKECLVSVPPLETQRRIAAILGAYDDLIEVNRRRVALLEEMARGLFEEWFVRFRFPGHEQVPLLVTPNGPIPQGWKISQLKSVAVLKSGYAFKSSTFVEEGSYSLVTIKHVHDGVLRPPFQSKLNQPPHNMPSHCRINIGDMLVSLTGNVGRTCLAWGKNLLLNQRVAKIVANRDDLRAFSYAWFRRPDTLKRLQQISNGAAQQNLSPVQTMELPIIIPPVEITESFQKFAGPILESCLLCHMTGATLEQQRDLLLPRLISGQLSVEAAEHQLEDAA